VLGGVIGGAFGSMFVRIWISDLSTSSWLWICFLMGTVVAGIALAAGRLVDRTGSRPAPQRAVVQINSSSPALEGARLVVRSRYLLSIAGIVGLYEIVSTILDYQFTSTVAYYLRGPAIGQHISGVFALTNIISLVVQLFLTSLVMTRYGLTVALLVLPAAILTGSAIYVAAPVLWTGSLLSTADNSFNYSINQSAKEALYVPTTADEKYKAKAFIDMFGQRFAKAVAVFVSLGLTSFSDFSATRWLSGLSIALALLWLYAARYAGSRFREVTHQGPAAARQQG